MSTYDNIPMDLSVIVTFIIQSKIKNAEAFPKEIPHVNVRELVAGIKNFSKEETKRLVSNDFPTIDDRVRYVFSKLVSEPQNNFEIDSDVIACSLLTAQVSSAAQSVLCLLRSIIDTTAQKEAQEVTQKINQLINNAKQPPELVLPNVLPGFISDSDVAAWLKNVSWATSIILQKK